MRRGRPRRSRGGHRDLRGARRLDGRARTPRALAGTSARLAGQLIRPGGPYWPGSRVVIAPPTGARAPACKVVGSPAKPVQVWTKVADEVGDGTERARPHRAVDRGGTRRPAATTASTTPGAPRAVDSSRWPRPPCSPATSTATPRCSRRCRAWRISTAATRLACLRTIERVLVPRDGLGPIELSRLMLRALDALIAWLDEQAAEPTLLGYAGVLATRMGDLQGGRRAVLRRAAPRPQP